MVQLQAGSQSMGEALASHLQVNRQSSARIVLSLGKSKWECWISVAMYDSRGHTVDWPLVWPPRKHVKHGWSVPCLYVDWTAVARRWARRLSCNSQVNYSLHDPLSYPLSNPSWHFADHYRGDVNCVENRLWFITDPPKPPDAELSVFYSNFSLFVGL